MMTDTINKELGDFDRTICKLADLVNKEFLIILSMYQDDRFMRKIKITKY